MDRRQGHRENLDRVAMVSWPLVLVLALIAALLFTLLALRL